MDSLPILSLVTFLPLVGACVVGFLPRASGDQAKKVALLFAVAGFLVSLPLLGYDAEAAGIQFAERYYWVPSLGISWHLGIDGISLWLVMLTTFLGPVVILGAWEAVEKRPREFFFHILALQTAMLGAFVAQNLAVFYLFWELMLVPMFFLIGVWWSRAALRDGQVRLVYGLWLDAHAGGHLLSVLAAPRAGHGWDARPSCDGSALVDGVR